jgi:GNAT superfamily N-acetyltransferase
MAALSATLRPLAATDSFEALTALLHRAYARLGAMGMNFTAADQSVQDTRRRVASGHCFVAEAAGEIVGTVTVCAAYDPNREPWARATPWFYRRDVAHLHQLAVDPPAQGQGLGDRLLAACEAWARAQGHSAVLLDTAVPATHLRQRYARLGYADVDEVQWPGKRYRSVLMRKALVEPAPSVADAEHHCALVRTLWADVQARDWAALRARYADTATMRWPCSGEAFLDADAIVRVNAIYPEGWTLRIVEVNALADGRVHSVIEITQDDSRFLANSIFRFDAGRVAEVEEYWATVEPPPAWRTAAAIGAYQRIHPTP